ncbi:MAG: preprotein translocase subunit YajC [Candidatus Adiutrix sp.]|jgi:preprotein translocase subunit YajC|nr:preprotein translocase subunit YajC [Candidatus Adiutrix sp.]
MTNLYLAAALAWAVDVAAGGADASGAAQQQSLIPTLLMFGGMFLFMYLILFRPQQKKQKEHQEMLNSLQKGDRIQTSGGIFGQITGNDQNELTVEIAPQVRVKIGRSFVARVIRPGQSDETKGKDKK